VFFDHLGVEWQYEPEGFMVGDRPYLPDFWLPEMRRWVEVKGVLDQSTLDLLLDAARPEVGLPVDPVGRRWTSDLPPGRLLLLGDIPHVRYYGWLHSRVDYRNGELTWSHVTFHEVPLFSGDTAPRDWLVGEPYRSSDPDEWALVAPGSNLFLHGHATALVQPASSVVDAYMAARSARFEHGEAG
jgi:hypothetical protein